MADNAFLELERVRRAGRRALLATVVRGVGPTYRRPGASAVIAEGGEVIGAISGGCLESDVIEAAARIFAGGPPRLLEYDTAAEEDLIWGTGSGCGGRVHVLVAPVADDLLAAVAGRLRSGRPAVVETVIAPGASLGRRRLAPEGAPAPGGAVAGAPFWYSDEGTVFHQVVLPPVTLILCGAGDDARPVARLAAAAGFRVIVVDHRRAWATPERFPAAEQVVACDPDELGARVEIRPGSFAVLLTHHYYKDLEHLKVLLSHPVAYVGLLGARERSRRLVQQLLADRPDLRAAARAVLQAPVGLDIGADGPEEIALAIVAEMVARRAGRPGLPLMQTRGPVVE